MMDGQLRYFEFGKFFFEDGSASDIRVLDQSPKFDIARYQYFINLFAHNPSPFRLEYKILINKPSTISVALVPAEGEFIFIQAQSRTDGEYAFKLKIPPKLNRSFIQTRCIILSPEEIYHHFKNGYALYSSLLYNNEESDRLVTKKYSLKDYFGHKQYQNEGFVSISQKISHVRPETIKVLSKIAKNMRQPEKQSDITNKIQFEKQIIIIDNNSLLDLKSKLEMMEQTQAIMLHEWGIISFALDPLLSNSVDIQFHNKDTALAIRGRNLEENNTIQLELKDFNKNIGDASLISKINDKRDQEPKKPKTFYAYLNWLIDFLTFYFYSLKELYEGRDSSNRDLLYWESYLNAANKINDLLRQYQSTENQPFVVIDGEIRKIISDYTSVGFGLGRYFYRLDGYYQEYSEQEIKRDGERKIISAKQLLSQALDINDFESVNKLLSYLRDLGETGSIDRERVLSAAQEFSNQNKVKHVVRYGNISAPQKLYKGQIFGVTVDLGKKPLSSSSPKFELTASTASEISSVEILISFNEKDFECLDDRVKSIVVHNRQLSSPVLFRLRALSKGTKKIKVHFFHKGIYKGQATLKIETLGRVQKILNDIRPGNRFNISMDDMELNLFELTNRNLPDLTIFLEKNEGKYQYRLFAKDQKLGLNLENVIGYIDFSATDPKKYMEEMYDELNQKIGSNLSDKVFFEDINSIGTQLFDKLFPDELKNLWWSKIRNSVRSILIISDETWVPWELIKPHHKDEEGKDHEDEFLCEKYSLGRWLQGKNSMQNNIDINKLNLVISSAMKDLDGHTEEMSLSELKQLDIQETPASLENMFLLLSNGGFNALHIACHNTYNSNNPDLSELELDNGEKLQPIHISGSKTNFGKNHPLIFINACASGRIARSLTGVGGWVPQFIGAGASVFVGSIWDVDNHSATPFARAFYLNLINGMTVGSAFCDARLKVKKAGDPSWLSYTIYANPDAVVIPPEKVKQLQMANHIVNKLSSTIGDQYGRQYKQQ